MLVSFFCFMAALSSVLSCGPPLFSLMPQPPTTPVPRYSLLLFFAGESPLFGLIAHGGQRRVWGATPCPFFLRGSTTVRPTRQW